MMDHYQPLTNIDLRALTMATSKMPRQQVEVIYADHGSVLSERVNALLKDIPEEDLMGVDFHDTLGQEGPFSVRALIRYRIWIDKDV